MIAVKVSSNRPIAASELHERAWLRDVYTVEVKVVCETVDWTHSLQLKNELKKFYSKVQFSDVPLALSNDTDS